MLIPRRVPSDSIHLAIFMGDMAIISCLLLVSGLDVWPNCEVDAGSGYDFFSYMSHGGVIPSAKFRLHISLFSTQPSRYVMWCITRVVFFLAICFAA